MEYISLQESLEIQKFYTPIASLLDHDQGEQFEILPRAIQFLNSTSNACLFMIADNSSCTELTLSLIQATLLKNNQVPVQQDRNLISIDCRVVQKNFQGVRKIIRHLKTTIYEQIQKSLLANSVKDTIVILKNFQSLNNKRLQIYKLIADSYRQKISISYIVTCSAHYITKEEVDYCFGFNNITAYFENFEINTRQRIISKIYDQLLYLKDNQIIQFYNISALQEYSDLINKQQILQQLCQDIENIPMTIYILPNLQQKLNSSILQNGKLNRYEILAVFNDQYFEDQYQQLILHNQQAHNQILEYLNYNSIAKTNSLTEYTAKNLTNTLLQILSWKMFQSQQENFLQQNDFKEVVNEYNLINKEDINIISQLLIFLGPLKQDDQGNLRFINTLTYQFFICQSIVHETLFAEGAAIDYNNSFLCKAFLSENIEILIIVAEYVQLLPTQNDQYQKFYQVWYLSVLQSRKIGEQNITDARSVGQIQRFASNCMSLLAATPYSDLTGRDFSQCSIPRAHLFGRDLSDSKFNQTNLENCDFTRTNIDGCTFQNCRMSGIKVGLGCFNLYGHSSIVYAVAISCDGKIVASVSQDKKLKLWDLLNCRELFSIQSHQSQIKAVTFSPDGKVLASGGYDKMVLWNLQKRRIFFSFKKFEFGVHHIIFSQDSKLIASGGFDCVIRLWDFTDITCIIAVKAHTSCVVSMAFSQDSKYLISGSFDETFKLYDVKGMKQIRHVKVQTNPFNSLAISADSKIFVSSFGLNKLKLWPIQNDKEIVTLNGHLTKIYSAIYSKNSEILASGSADDCIKLWDTQTNNLIVSIKGSHEQLAQTFNSMPAAENYLEETPNFIDMWGTFKVVQTMTFSPDSKILVSGDWEGTVSIWEVLTEQELNTLKKYTRNLNQVTSQQDQQAHTSLGANVSATNSNNQNSISNISDLMIEDKKIQIEDFEHQFVQRKSKFICDTFIKIFQKIPKGSTRSKYLQFFSSKMTVIDQCGFRNEEEKNQISKIIQKFGRK